MQFLPRHPPRPLRARLLVAETGQEKTTAWLEDCRQARHVLFPVFVGEDVKQAAVNHVVKPFRPTFEVRGILEQKCSGQTLVGCFSPGSLNRFFQKVDASYFVTSACEKQGVVASAAASIEDRTGNLVGHVDERFLRLANVPGGLAGIK